MPRMGRKKLSLELYTHGMDGISRKPRIVYMCFQCPGKVWFVFGKVFKNTSIFFTPIRPRMAGTAIGSALVNMLAVEMPSSIEIPFL